MQLTTRLDFYATSTHHKPRHGLCQLCARPVINHPLLAHRWHALLNLIETRYR